MIITKKIVNVFAKFFNSQQLFFYYLSNIKAVYILKLMNLRCIPSEWRWAVTREEKSTMRCHTKKDLLCGVMWKKIYNAMSSKKKSMMQCHVKKDLSWTVTRKKIYHEMPCKKNLKRNLRCNVTRKKIYHEMPYEKRFEKRFTMRFKKRSTMQCHAKKDLSCVSYEKKIKKQCF